MVYKVNLEHFRRELKSVNIQGASAVARATLQAVAEYAAAGQAPVKTAGWRKLRQVGGELARLRPTEPMARNLVHGYLHKLEKDWPSNSRTMEWADYSHRLADEFIYLEREAGGKVSSLGSRLVKTGQIIFTHCHSSLAEGILAAARRNGKSFQVYHTETRPLFQGRITNRRLRQARLPVTMVADSAAAYLVSEHSGDDVKVSWVLLGADSLGRDGSVINKIGSFGIALAAYDSRIPVYVAVTLFKLDWSGETKIEIRSNRELWSGAPRGTRMVNYAFDKIPAKYITGIICEFGVVKPRQVAKLAKRHYPWLIKMKNEKIKMEN